MGIVPAAIARSPSLSAFSAQDPESPGGAHGDSTAPLFLDAGTDGGASCFDVESGRRPPSTNNNNSNQSVHNYYPCSLIPFTTFTTPPPRLWPSPLCLAAAWSTW
ncbi:hypothetical protein CSUB01_11554 [Colletotrichum sublineola]|uniref:Uncharacterized protein n=1 Tax=Colletotrichum sublineola TaxID=1173701 RepID=A0A066X2I5_COLSU|nr:hypothetical protein CSUB01_11554 [Colletotrichum sublineola]